MKYLGPPQSGSYQSITASRNPFGQYYRARVGRGGVPWQSIGDADAAWDALTDGQRFGWDAWAANLVQNDRLGRPQRKTGRMWFVRQWLLAARVGASPLSSAPAGYDRMQVAALAGVDAGGGEADFSATLNGPGWVEFQSSTLSRPENAGVSRPPGKHKYWLVRGYALGAGVGWTAGQAIIATLYTPGQKTWCRARTMHQDTRLLTPWVMAGPVVLS